MTTLETAAVRGNRPPPDSPLLEVKGLNVTFPSLNGDVHALRGVDLSLSPGDSVAILGESGSGKSVSSRAMMGMIDSPPARMSGSIRFEGSEIVGKADAQLRDIRGPGIAMVFQDALDGLNPVYSIGSQVGELLRVRLGYSRRQARAETLHLMNQVGIPDPEDRIDDYPHQFSGGMRQRVCIAMAIALKPRLLIADEPTTALDVTVQAEILGLIARLREKFGMTLIFVTHDLSLARMIASRLVVMYSGRVMEEGPIEEVFANAANPYTRALLKSHPSAASHWTDLQPIAGSPPDKTELTSGCPFHPRCRRAVDICRSQRPALERFGKGRASRCHFWQEVLDD